ncbi:MAG TPA: MFS transporter [Fimbriimonadaceae bacterium]
MDHPKSTTRSRIQTDSFYLIVLFIFLGIFATTLPQPQVLGKIPLQNLLKSKLDVSASQMAWFFLACNLFWYLMPLAGILTDAFPIFGTRRRHYALISATLAALSWGALAFVPRTFNWLLISCIVINLFMVMMSTVTGAVLVEIGQSTGSVGRLTAVKQFATNFGNLIQGPLGGLLATGALGLACGVNGAFLVCVIPATYFILKEKPFKQNRQAYFHNAGGQIKTIGLSKTFWWALVFITLFYFAPGFTTLLYYRQTDILKLDQLHIGYLTAFGGFGGLLGAVLYGWATRRFNLKSLLIFAIVTAALATFMYLTYDSYPKAILTDFSNGFFFGFAEVAFIDLAARATPVGCEGLGYSLMLSFRNMALYGADFLGAKLSDEYHWTWKSMVILNGGTTAVVIILLPFISKAILSTRDIGVNESAAAYDSSRASEA